MKKFPLALATLFSATSLSSAAVFDLSTGSAGDFVVIDGAAFVLQADNSGSGNFRDLYRLQTNGTQDGYNREGAANSGDFESIIPMGFQPGNQITIGELGVDSTGDFYVFAIDVNENDDLISLDAFSLYTHPADPITLPTTVAGLDSTFNEVYSIASDDTILINGGIGSGSGASDLFIYVPTTAFAGIATTEQVYLYTSFGEYGAIDGDFASGQGAENIAAFADGSGFTSPIPEPSSVVTTIMGVMGLLAVRRRKQA